MKKELAEPQSLILLLKLCLGKRVHCGEVSEVASLPGPLSSWAVPGAPPSLHRQELVTKAVSAGQWGQVRPPHPLPQ